MEIIVSQFELSQALHACAKAVPSRPAHPIMINVLMEASGGSLIITGYDLSLGIQATIPASVSTPGTTAVPYRLLSEIISKLPSDSPLAISVSDEVMKISSTSGSYELGTSNPEDFPDFPNIAGDAIVLPASDLARAAKSVAFCASSDKSKGILMGINIAGSSNAIKCAATDGHRLGVAKFPTEGDCDINLTIPSASLLEAIKLAEGDVEITRSKDHRLLITSRNMKIATSAFAGVFPNYGQLIPDKFARSAIIDRKALAAAIGRVAIVAAITNNVVKLSFDDSNQQLEIKADAEGSKASESLPIELEGKGLTIAFNARYLADALKGLAGEKVIMNCNGEATPVTFVNEDNDNQTYLIMPVQVKAQ